MGSRVGQWVETGVEGGKITKHSPTYFDVGVLSDQTNRRNAFQQALIYARSQFLKRKEKGGEESRPKVISKSPKIKSPKSKSPKVKSPKSKSPKIKSPKIKSPKSKSPKIKSPSVNIMYFPMLAKAFKDGEKHLKFPLYVQPKLDGVRCLVFLKKKSNNLDDVIVYSRAKKEYPNMDYLKKAWNPWHNYR